MRALKIITGHVIHNPAYTYKFQLKTTKNIFRVSPWSDNAKSTHRVRKNLMSLMSDFMINESK